MTRASSRRAAAGSGTLHSTAVTTPASIDASSAGQARRPRPRRRVTGDRRRRRAASCAMRAQVRLGLDGDELGDRRRVVGEAHAAAGAELDARGRCRPGEQPAAVLGAAAALLEHGGAGEHAGEDRAVLTDEVRAPSPRQRWRTLGATPRGPRTGSRTSGLRCVWHTAGHERVRTPAGIGCRRRARVRRRRGRGPRARRRHRRVPGRSLHRDHGPLGLGQVDADAHPRRPRPARRAARSSLDGVELVDLDDKRADQAAPRQGRLRLPVLQPAARPRRAREHRAAAVDRRAQARRGVARPAHRHRRPARPPRPPARPSSPAASSSASPWRARWPRARRSSSPTSRPATSTRSPRASCSTCCAARSTSSARR